MKRRTRNKSGSAIIEFGPALFILLVLLFFPMLDLIMLALTYSDCLYLNALLLRQASCENVLALDSSTPPKVIVSPDPTVVAKTTADLNSVVSQWSNGFGKFAITVTPPTVSSTIDVNEGTAKVKYIHVLLDCQCRPFLQIPLFFAVPGLSAPMDFKFNTRSVIENVPS